MSTAKKIGELITNLTTSRVEWLRRLMDPRRDISVECGHPLSISLSDYKDSFDRRDMATRVVSLYPDECWRSDPEVFETDDPEQTAFEKAWSAVQKKQKLYSRMHKIDVLSGIGSFGVLLLGVDDGGKLETAIQGMKTDGTRRANAADRQLLYTRTFDQSVVRVKDLENNPASPRYGQPLMYELDFTDATGGLSIDSSGEKLVTITKSVHWSRIIHVADNCGNSDIYGEPRMKKVFDRLLDLRKVAGGAGEMFWKGGFPGLSLEAMPSKDEILEFDEEKTKEQIEAYMNGLQRYIATVGMQVKSLSAQISDPRPFAEVQVRLIAAALSCPWRILLGVEVGSLASEQDIRAWNGRMQRRREEYLTPYLITPVVNRLIAIGVLPEPKEGEDSVMVAWKDLNSPSDQDKATIAEKRTNALLKYVSAGLDRLIPPFHYLTLVVGMTTAEAESVIKAAGPSLKNLGPLAVIGGRPGENANGRPARAKSDGRAGTLLQAPDNAGRTDRQAAFNELASE